MGYKRGQEIFRCQPFSHVISKSARSSACDFCLRSRTEERASDMQRCSGCKIVYYCQPSCQKRKILNFWLLTGVSNMGKYISKCTVWGSKFCTSPEICFY